MGKPLRVLIVEDSEDDALLVIRKLERGGYDTTFERVETAEAMAAALEKQVWDIIIADYHLPHFSAPEALELFHQSGLELPFIVVSGTVGEETAVATMKDGAHDYLMKDNLTRLVPAIERELHEAEVRKEHKLVQEELQRAEQNFRNSIDNSPLGIRIVTAEGVTIYANQAMLDIYGYSSVEELKATPVKKRYIPESYAEHQERKEKRKLGKPDPPSYEVSIVRKDGGIRHLVLSRKEVVWGGEVQYQVIHQDITERKRADYNLKERMKEIQCLHSLDLIGARPKLTMNEICQEVVSVLPQAWQYPEVTAARLTLHDKEFETKNYRDTEWKQSSDVKLHGVKAGEVQIVYLEEKPKLDEGPFMKEERQLINSVAEQLARMIEGKQAEDALRQSEESLKTYLESAPDGVYIIDLKGTFLYGNKKAEEIMGYKREELIGKSFLKLNLLLAKYLAKAGKLLALNAMGRSTGPDEFELIKSDGSRVWVEINATPIKQAEEKVVVIGFVREITERKHAEERIKQAAEEWRTTFDSIADLVSIHDKDFRLVRVNKAFADVFNMKPQELVGKTCYQVVHGTNECVPHCPHMKTLETREPAMADFFEPHLGIHLEVSTSPIFNDKGEVLASVHVARDITERKKMEEQLIVTDRLASIGELASGIAHELNNPLTGVIGFSELLLDKDISDDVREDLKVINREAKRTADVVRNLLTFARKHTPEKQQVNINSIIEKVLELRAYEQKVNNIEVNTQFDPDLPEVIADGFQLQQVFLNIIINAEHFMTEAHGRGTLTIITERVGNTIKASFADDGPGIAKENLGHLFDPFFTTKEVGKGTGLGLSICHGILAEHDGRIYAESDLGKGATFVVELPVSK